MNEHRKGSLCSTHTCMRALDVWKLIFFIAIFQCSNLCLIFCSIQSYTTVHLMMSAASSLSSTGISLHIYNPDSTGLCAALNLSSSTAAIPVASCPLQHGTSPGPQIVEQSSQPSHECRFATHFMLWNGNIHLVRQNYIIQTPLFFQTDQKSPLYLL